MGAKQAKMGERSEELPFEGAITMEELQGLMEPKDYTILKKAGNVEGVMARLRTDPKMGLTEAEADLQKRRL